MDFAHARYYGSSQGRFTSPDPFSASAIIADPQTFNRYAYCRNNPVNSTDPTGLIDHSVAAAQQERQGTIDSMRETGLGIIAEEERRYEDYMDAAQAGLLNNKPLDDPINRGSEQDQAQNTGQMSEQDCNNRLAAIFGGPAAVAATVHEPTTLLSSVHGIDRSGHLVNSGVFHLYTNPQGTEATTGLYRPPGGRLVSGGEYYNGRTYNPDGTIKDEGKLENYFRFSYNSGPLKGVKISFVHVGGTSGGEGGGQRLGRFSGDTNAAGSVRIGNIGGLGGEGYGYNHTHIKVFLNGKLTDPRKVFCK